MRLADVAGYAGRALGAERRRTLLALLGTAVGIAAVLVMVAIGEGALRLVRDQFATLGPNVLAVLPGKSETAGVIPGLIGAARALTLADAEALQRSVDDLTRVAPMALGTSDLAAGSRSRRVLVVGTSAELAGIRRLEVRAGSFLADEPWERPTPGIVLGAALTDELFPGQSPLNQTVRLGHLRLRVIGVLAGQGTHFGVDLDQSVMVPVATALRLFDQESLDRIALQVRPGFELGRVERSCRAVLLARHGVEDFTLTTPDALLEAFEEIVAALTLALASIASISLFVAGIGIMNVMLVSVAERTAEIGLLRALGATRATVARIFLVEAGLISACGGSLGLVLGIAVVQLAQQGLPVLPAAVPAWAALAGLALALASGLLSGLAPALRAARVDPVVSLSGRRP